MSCPRNTASSSAARRWSPTPISGRSSAAISARSTTISAATGFAGSFLIVQSTGGLYEAEQAQEPLRAHAGIGSGRRRHRHAGAVPHARHRRMRSPSTWAAPPPRPASSTMARRSPPARPDRRLRQGAAGADRDDGHFRGRHRRRLDRAGRGGRPARRPAERGRGAGSRLLWPRRQRADRDRRQPPARPARRRPLPRRRDAARRRRGAKRALDERVAKPLGMDATAAADGILRIAATAMSYAVKGVTTERGLDAGDFALVAYGGAGPLHAVAVAREIGMRTVIIPTAPGVFSAFGMLFSDLRYDFVRTWFTRLDDAPFDEIERVYRELEKPGPRGHRRHLGQAAEDRASSAPPTCAMSARSTRSPSICRSQVFEREDRDGDQAPVRRDARAALRHVGAGRARRDRQPAHAPSPA